MSQHIPSSTVLREKLQIINDAAITNFASTTGSTISADVKMFYKGEAKLKADHAGFNHNLPTSSIAG